MYGISEVLVFAVLRITRVIQSCPSGIFWKRWSMGQKRL